MIRINPPNNSSGGLLPTRPGGFRGGGLFGGGGIITVHGYPKIFLRRFAPEVMYMTQETNSDHCDDVLLLF